jgi:hypothetical protein
MSERREPSRFQRRDFLRVAGAGVLVGGVAPGLAVAAGRAASRGAVIPAPVGGSAEPYPIPWLDKNGSHNQAGPGLDPSHVFHFQGRVARAAGFTGSGTDGEGNRLLFGTQTTDNSLMDGECWTSQRRVRAGTWTHL